MRKFKLYERIEINPVDYNNLAYIIGKISSGESLGTERNLYWHYTRIGVAVIQNKLKNKKKYSKRSISYCLRVY